MFLERGTVVRSAEFGGTQRARSLREVAGSGRGDNGSSAFRGPQATRRSILVSDHEDAAAENAARNV